MDPVQPDPLAALAAAVVPPAPVVVPAPAPPPPPPAPVVVAPPAVVAPVVATPPAVVPPVVAPAPTDPRIDSLMAIVREDVARDLAAVSEGVRATVLDIAGTDPIAQRSTLATMRANGIAGPVVLPVGASTAAPAGQPAPAPVVTPDTDALTRYEALGAKGAHLVAAQFRNQNGAAIERALAARNVSRN